MGSGQFCTKPGLVFAPVGSTFYETIKSYLATFAVAPLLSKTIADRYSSAISQLASLNGVEVLAGAPRENGFGVTPTFFITDWKTATTHPELLEEHFGPTTVIIKADESTYIEIAQALSGQLTSTIHGTEKDQIQPLIQLLSQKSGRVIWNGFPTGVVS